MGKPYEFISAAEVAKVEKRFKVKSLAATAQAICEKYGLSGMTEYDVADVLKAENELAICVKCKGMPCRKNGNVLQVPVISPEFNGCGARIDYIPCRYAPNVQAEHDKRQIDLIERQYGVNYATAAKRISAEYGLGNPRPDDVKVALGAEKELRQCEGCRGLPCPKNGFIPEIGVEDGRLAVRYGLCHFSRQYKEQRAREKALEAEKLALKSARIPKRYLGKTLADYKVDANNKNAVYYAEHSLEIECGAFLYGKCGCGKTFLAALIAQMWLAAGKSVIFIKVPALLDDLRATYNGTGNESDIYQAMHRADLLILDDMGMEKPSRYAGTTLCKIIDDRYDNDAPVIITSNNTLATIEYDLNHAHDGENLNGSRIADRLKEFCKPIQLKGESRR